MARGGGIKQDSMRIGCGEDLTRWHNLAVWAQSIHGTNGQQIHPRLATGRRINSAMDDAAGLAITEGLRAQSNGARQAQRNIQDGISMLNIADSGLGESMSILQRLRVIAVQSANGTFSAVQRQALQEAVNHSLKELDAIAQRTSYHEKSIFAPLGPVDGSGNGQANDPLTLQVGANQGDTVTLGRVRGLRRQPSRHRQRRRQAPHLQLRFGQPRRRLDHQLQRLVGGCRR